MSAAPTIVDQALRDRIESELETTFVVEAAAGSGKTSVLVARLMSALRSGESPSQIAALTFTRKAGAELRERLRRALLAASQEEPGGHLESCLASLSEAYLGTLHGFCERLLRGSALEAGLDPSFIMLDDAEAASLRDRALSEWLQSRSEDAERARMLRRVLTRPSWKGPYHGLRNALRKRAEFREFDASWHVEVEETLDRGMMLFALASEAASLGRSATRLKKRDPLRTSLRLIGAFGRTAVAALREAGLDSAEDSAASLVDSDIRPISPSLGLGEQEADKVLDGVERDLAVLLGEHRYPKKGWDAALLKERNDFLEKAKQRKEALESDLAAALFESLAIPLARYEALKKERGAIDQLDLLIRAREMLRGNPEMRTSLRQRFTRVAVDEYQDTDPIQDEIVRMLCEDDAGELSSGKLFVVGDPKQAIYRFRRATIESYERAVSRLVEAGAERVALTASFRSRPTIQALVNHVFSKAMGASADGSHSKHQADYVPLSKVRSPASHPEVVALPLREPFGRWGSSPYGFSMNESDIESTTAFVQWLCSESGWEIEDSNREGAKRAIEPRDIAMLFPQVSKGDGDARTQYADELRERGVAVSVRDDRAFVDRDEVRAVLSSLAAIEWPDDRFRVYACLKSALFGFSDELLLDAVHASGIHPLELAPEPSEAEGAEESRLYAALRDLGELHGLRNRRTVSESLRALFGISAGVLGFALQAGGVERTESLAELMRLARDHDERGGTLRGFIEWMEGDERPRPRGGQENAVQLMTIHGAKGLEFPVVILCSPGTASYAAREYFDWEQGLAAYEISGITPAPLVKHAAAIEEAGRAEKLRLLYVAATRARDILVLSASGLDPAEGFWLDPISSALYPPRRERDNARAPRSCPPLGERISDPLPKPAQDKGLATHPMVPGAHDLPWGEVVWWGLEPLQAMKPVPQRVDQKAFGKGPGSEAGEKQYAEHRARRERALRFASAPSLESRTVTEEAATGAPVTSRTTTLEVGSPPREVGGARFGTLVHAVLYLVPLVDASPELVRSLVEGQALDLGASAAERDAAFDAVMATLAHPIFERVREAEQVCRETSVFVRGEDGQILEGVIDLAFLEDDPFGEHRWTVIDYKTDLSGSPPEHYARQVELYAEAIEKATGIGADPVLLGV